MLLTSTLSHRRREAVPTRLATTLTGIPAEILLAKLPVETTKQPCQMVLGLCRALAKEALGQPYSKAQAFTTGLCCIPTYLQHLLPVCILMSADVKISKIADPGFTYVLLLGNSLLNAIHMSSLERTVAALAVCSPT